MITTRTRDEQAVLLQAVEQLKRCPEGRSTLAMALRQAAWAYEDNAHEYEKTGAFDPDRQLHLAEIARQQADDIETHTVAWEPGDDIPF